MLKDIVIFSGVLINMASMNCIPLEIHFFFYIVHGSIVLLMIMYVFNLLVNTPRGHGIRAAKKAEINTILHMNLESEEL